MEIFLQTIGSINDETRIKILRFINENGEVCVCDIESSFNMIQSRISRHLKILRDGGFLKVRREGRWAYYSIRSPIDKFSENVLNEIACLDLEIPQLKKVVKLNKKVLILCTGNSCRSIMAEALINAKLGECVEAQSSGVKASGAVNPHAQALLESKGYWRDEYHSKVIETVLDTPFDLIVTVCDHAKETCPMFPKAVKTIHVGFDDPSGKAVEEYEKTLNLIEKELLPVVKEELC